MKFVSLIDFEIVIGTEENGTNEKAPFGFALHTYGGLQFTRRMTLSAGTGIIRSFNKQSWAIPLIADFRWYLNPIGYQSPYMFINTGKFLDIGDSFSTGQTAKLGLGYLIESDYNFFYTIELFRFSRTFNLKNSASNFFVNGIDRLCFRDTIII